MGEAVLLFRVPTDGNILEMLAFSLGPQRTACLTIWNSGRCSIAPYMVQVCTLTHLRLHLHTPNTLAGGGVWTVLQRKSLLSRQAQRTFHSAKLLRGATPNLPLLHRKKVITLYARQQKRHRCIEQSFGLCGRGRGWDDMGEWH